MIYKPSPKPDFIKPTHIKYALHEYLCSSIQTNQVYNF